ncbi:hypothetical protein [Phaeobacter inhibens]|uniref:hypothetical protein n=1 Tax=Phaeobacter inhibens TaxID=221822 RepID=UPI0021A460DE|nr:hypothetical protein [Phaeobacter inhibens]UWR61393.1 hypothetical protein K4F88_03365 [Phaeobacter inhibens]
MGGMIGTMRGDRMLRAGGGGKTPVGPFQFGVSPGATFSVSSKISSLTGLTVSRDGLNAYVTDIYDDTVHRFALATGWDVSSASDPNDSLAMSGRIGSLVGVEISQDGSKLYAMDSGVNVEQWSLAAPFDLSTASYDGSGAISGNTALRISGDGYWAYAVSQGSSIIRQYSLGTQWDMTTATAAGTLLTSTDPLVDGQPYDIQFFDEGARALVLIGTEYTLYEYVIATPYDLRTAAATGYRLPGIREIVNGRTFAINPASKTSIWVSDGVEQLYQFEF